MIFFIINHFKITKKSRVSKYVFSGIVDEMKVFGTVKVKKGGKNV